MGGKNVPQNLSFPFSFLQTTFIKPLRIQNLEFTAGERKMPKEMSRLKVTVGK